MRDGWLHSRHLAFPGPVAIPVDPIQDAVPVVGTEEADDEPWAVEIGYQAPTRHVLTVRTVRSTEGLNPHGRTVESLASAVVNYLNRDQNTRPGTAFGDRIRERISASRHTRATVEGTPTIPTIIVIDGVAVEGRRVDLDTCSAVELAWGRQRVFCTGQPDIIDNLRLRSATPDDFG